MKFILINVSVLECRAARNISTAIIFLHIVIMLSFSALKDFSEMRNLADCKHFSKYTLSATQITFVMLQMSTFIYLQFSPAHSH